MGGGTSHVHYIPDHHSAQRADQAAREAAAATREAAAAQQALQDLQGTRDRLTAENQAFLAAEGAQAVNEKARFDARLAAAEREHRQQLDILNWRVEEERKATLREQEAARQAELLAREKIAEEQRRREVQARVNAERLEGQRLETERRLSQVVQEERQKARDAIVKRWLELTREYPVPEFLKQYISEVTGDEALDAQSRRINIAVAGDSGSGKSSLIRAILKLYGWCPDGAELPRASLEGDGTRSPTPYVVPGFQGFVVIWDMPGQGTKMFPHKTYLKNSGMKYFDVVLIVTAGRWTEGDASLMQAVRFAGTRFCVVRSKIDDAVEAGLCVFDMTQEQTLKQVRETLMKQLGEPDCSRIHLVTSYEEFWVQRGSDAAFGLVQPLCEQIVAHVQAGAQRAAESGDMRDAAEQAVDMDLDTFAT